MAYHGLKNAPPAPPARTEPTVFPSAEACGRRLRELAAHRARLVSAIIQLEGAAVRPELLPDRKAKERLAAAGALLESDAAVTAAEGTADISTKLALMLQVKGDIDEAQVRGEALLRNLEHQEAAARFETRRSDFTKTMRGVTMAIVALERALQERDALLRELRPAGPPPGSGWPLLGRLHLFGGASYKWLVMARDQGWISQREFQHEIEAAKAASERP